MPRGASKTPGEMTSEVDLEVFLGKMPLGTPSEGRWVMEGVTEGLKKEVELGFCARRGLSLVPGLRLMVLVVRDMGLIQRPFLCVGSWDFGQVIHLL